MTIGQKYGTAGVILLGLGVIVAATVLCALHDLDGQAVVALFGAAIGLVGGGAGSLAAVAQQTNGNSVISNGHLAQLTATLQEAIHTSQVGAQQPPVEPAAPPPAVH